MRYSDFVERVASFRTSSVTDTCAFILWDQFGQRFSAAEQQDVALLRAFGARIAVIAATHGAESTAKLACGGDLFRLAHEFLEVDDGVLAEDFQAEERRKLFECWTDSAILGRYRLTDQCLAEATLARTLMRMMRSQWDLTNAHSHALPRAWELVRRVQRRAPTLDPIGYLKRALAMEPENFLRTAFLLFAMNARGHGQLDIRGARLLGAFPETWDMRSDDLLFVCERLSIHADDLRRWDQEVVAPLPDAFRKFAPTPLPRFPLIQRREQMAAPVALRGRYVTPCPGSAQLALQNVCAQLLREAPPTGSRSHAVELGHALEEYLHDYLVSIAGSENVLRVDAIARDTRRADLIVVAGSKAFVIESKSLLGSSTAKAVAEAQESVRIWEKIHGAFEQCACTVRDEALWRANSRLASVTEVASLVCFDEVLCIEGTAFNALSACAGICGGLGVQRIETVTVQYLESVISWYGLERLFGLIAEKWAAGRQGDDLTAFIASKKQGPSRKQGRTPPHLLSAFNDLFPGVPEA